jgi:hypothetical protein
LISEPKNDTTIDGSGAMTDYAIVMISTPPENSNNYEWSELSASPGINDRIAHQRGPFRPAIIPPANPADPVPAFPQCYNHWEPRDSFARLEDGTSNQLIIGEKHIPVTNLGKCEGWGGTNISADCNYLVAWETWYAMASARTVKSWVNTSVRLMPLANSPDYNASLPGGVNYNGVNNYGFGGNHPGICQFVLGDGSVKSIAVTTPVDNVLERLCNVSDGEPVRLP